MTGSSDTDREDILSIIGEVEAEARAAFEAAKQLAASAKIKWVFGPDLDSSARLASWEPDELLYAVRPRLEPSEIDAEQQARLAIRLMALCRLMRAERLDESGAFIAGHNIGALREGLRQLRQVAQD